MDIWRSLQKKKDDTVFPHPHSRRDNFLVSQVTNSTIGIIVMWDSAPVELVIAAQERVNILQDGASTPSLVNSEDSRAAIRSMISEFVEFKEKAIKVLCGMPLVLLKGPSHAT